MTSPYNIVRSDTNNLSQPQWLGLFDSKYQYYHVLKAAWNMAFTIGFNGVQQQTAPSNETVQQFYSFYVYWKYTNYDDPPTQFSVDLTGKTTYGTTTQDLTPDDYDRMRGWNKIWVQAKNTKAVRRVIAGHYETGQCQMDVKMISDPNHAGAADPEDTAGHEPGIENTIEPIRHVWRRFPNHETAELKWIYTQMMGATSNNTDDRPSGSAWDQKVVRDITLPNT